MDKSFGAHGALRLACHRVTGSKWVNFGLKDVLAHVAAQGMDNTLLPVHNSAKRHLMAFIYTLFRLNTHVTFYR
jgi:hypothetical protein